MGRGYSEWFQHVRTDSLVFPESAGGGRDWSLPRSTPFGFPPR